MSECQKLKEVLLADNPIKDSRLKKLTAQKPPKSKAVLDYVREHCAYLGRTVAEESGKKGAGKPKKKKGEKSNDADERAKDEIQVIAAGEDSKRIVVKPSVISIRPYIVCCILRNLQLDEPAKLQKFISIQACPTCTSKIVTGLLNKRSARICRLISTMSYARKEWQRRSRRMTWIPSTET